MHNVCVCLATVIFVCIFCALYNKSFTNVSYNCNDSAQCHQTFYHCKLQNFAMS